MLTVNNNLKRPRRVSETSFEGAFAKALLLCGAESWHMNMREKGWPDRYVQGGIWIEFKVLDTLGSDDGTEKEQRTKMAELERSGDWVFYAARCGNDVVFAPWSHCVAAGRDTSKLPRYRYKNKNDLIHIIRYAMEGHIENGDRKSVV